MSFMPILDLICQSFYLFREFGRFERVKLMFVVVGVDGYVKIVILFVLRWVLMRYPEEGRCGI